MEQDHSEDITSQSEAEKIEVLAAEGRDIAALRRSFLARAI